jgi:hypothetical protein
VKGVAEVVETRHHHRVPTSVDQRGETRKNMALLNLAVAAAEPLLAPSPLVDKVIEIEVEMEIDIER